MSDPIQTGIPCVCSKCGHTGDAYIKDGPLLDIIETMAGERMLLVHAALIDQVINLGRYAQHHAWCKVDEYENEKAGRRAFPCTCGFRAAQGKEP